MTDKTILIVEDNLLNLELFTDLLEASDYNVLSAASANEAIDILSKNKPELIITDIQLPGIDGIELTKIIKNNPLLRDIPVIALTAYAMRGDKEKILNAGCDGYIAKPINTKEFVKNVESFFS